MEPYRQPEAPPPDLEAAAVAELDRRVRRARTALIVGVILGGVGVGALGYFVMQEIQFALSGVALIKVSCIAGGVCFGLVLMASERIVRGWARRHAAMLRPVVAKKYGVPEYQIAEMTTHLD